MDEGYDNEETVEVTFDEVITTTAKAILYKIGDAKVWIPKSQILFEKVDRKEIEIPAWLAKEKELV